MNKLLLILLILPIIGLSQNTITGKIVGQTNEPIEYAEVVLQTLDLIAIKSELTNEEGVFTFKDIAKGTYKLNIQYFSQNIFSKIIKLEGNLDLETIITNAGLNLSEVVITGKKPLIERKVDRLVFNIENSVAATGGNGLDALKLAPRIKVQNDEISMIGKGSVAVLINDRIVQMSSADLATYLKSLNAEDIKSIEVISNPPAKYSAEGNSGLVNIVLKKAKNDAWNASLRSIYQQATYAKGNAGGSFNMQKGKFQINTAVSYTNGSNAPQETNKIYYPNLTWDEVNNRRDFTNALSTRLGLEYKINDKLSTGFTYNYITSKPLIKEIDKTTLTNSSNSVLDSLISTLGRNEYDKKLNSLNYHVIYDIDTIGRKLSLDVDYFNYKNKTNRIFSTQSFFPNNQSIPNSLEEARNFGNQDITNYSINLDMEHPTNWATYNYGARVSFTETDNLFNYFDIIDDEEILNPNFSNQFKYQENTQALYFSAQKSFSDKWEAKVGLRYEFTQTEGFSQTLNQTNTNDYSKLFPTAYVAFTPNDNHSFSLNYGRRIARPNFGYLNPFRFVNNPYSYSEGNPFLQPAFTDNIEFEYAFKDNLITNIYYSYTDDDFEQVTIIDANTNVQQVIPLNFIVNKMFGITQTFIFKPAKWWDVNASADVYYSDTKSKIPVTLQFLSGWSGEFNISNDFTLNTNKTFLGNLNYNYTTEGIDNLDYNSNANQLDIALKWLLLDKSLIISLYANDILSSNRFTYTTFSNGIENSFRNYYDERFFRIGVIYNFGKKFNLNNRENKNQDEYNRTN
ncbi:TonB-dependent receptor domain-containing protein [Psychroflexus sp. MBR-150]|jgi:hypothetical protein